MTSTQLIGLAAAALTTVAFFPQVVKTWRSKSAEDVSLLTFGTFCCGVFLWLMYGLLIGDVAIILANGITLPAALSIYGLTLRYRLRDARRAREEEEALHAEEARREQATAGEQATRDSPQGERKSPEKGATAGSNASEVRADQIKSAR